MMPPCVSLGVASRARLGQTLSGDAFLARPLAHGYLVAVADGLGHGEAAASAARLGLEALASCEASTLASAVEASHRRLHGTRGAAISVAVLDAHAEQLSWLGVGNVEGALWRPGSDAPPRGEPLLVHSGIVGLRIPPLAGETVGLRRGDVLVVATDGVRPGFRVDPRHDPQLIADAILSRHGRRDDDALVLAARFLGSPA